MVTASANNQIITPVQPFNLQDDLFIFQLANRFTTSQLRTEIRSAELSSFLSDYFVGTEFEDRSELAEMWRFRIKSKGRANPLKKITIFKEVTN